MRIPCGERSLRGPRARPAGRLLLREAEFLQEAADAYGERGGQPCTVYALRADPGRPGFLLAGVLVLRARRTRSIVCLVRRNLDRLWAFGLGILPPLRAH